MLCCGGILPLIQKFYETTDCTPLGRDRQAYSALTGRYHEALAKMLFDTQIYLKMASSNAWAEFHGYTIRWRAGTNQRPELRIGIIGAFARPRGA
jgi:hypothetical protein